MSTNFPGALDTTTQLPNTRASGNTIPATDNNNKSDAILAIEAKLGYAASTPTTPGHVLTVTGAGTTAYSAPATGAAALDDLTDVAITSLATGDVLKWNGSNWINDDDLTAGGGGGANLTATLSATQTVIVSDTGTDATIPAADTTNAGVMTAAMKTKLDSVATGATANDTDANLKARANHTGTQTASTISDFTTAADARIAAATATGTGSIVRATSPALVTPTGIVKGDVGLGNVDNTSDATKNAATATLTNKTLTAPVINAPTGFLSGAAKITVGTATPASPSTGDIWIDTN